MLRVDHARWGQTVEDLREQAVAAAHALTRERYLALYEVARDSNATAVAGACGRNPQTVMKWVRRYNEDGPGALAYAHSGGRPPFAER